MMRINQFSNASMFQTQASQNTRAANQDFRTSLQNNSRTLQGMQAGNNQPQQIAGQQNNIQPTPARGDATAYTAPEGFSGFSGVINMPQMPEMPEMPDGEEDIDGGMGMQRPDDLPEIPEGEEPPAKPDESDGGMGMPPSGMPGGFSGMQSPGGMQRPGGSFSGMNGMGGFSAMSFAMNMRQA